MGKQLTYLLLLCSILTFGCTWHKDYPHAILQAESCMDEHPDSALQMLAYYYQGSAYRDLNDAPRALEANKQSVQQYLLQGKKNQTSYALRDIARMYDAKEQRDSALHYYQEACETALNAKDSNRYYSILSELGGIYYSLLLVSAKSYYRLLKLKK